MNRSWLKYKVKQLRIKGNTYSEIKEILGVKIPKSTLSYWCNGLALPFSYKEKIRRINKAHLNKIRRKALSVNKEARRKYLDGLLSKNLNLLKNLDLSVQKLLLSILYLAEGAKHKSTKFLSLGNSDPKIIKFYLTLLKNCFPIDEKKFRGRVQCRFDQDKSELGKFWRNVTGFKREQFYPTYVDMRTKGKKTLKENYKGICTIHYFSTEIQLELELLADRIMETISG